MVGNCVDLGMSRVIPQNGLTDAKHGHVEFTRTTQKMIQLSEMIMMQESRLQDLIYNPCGPLLNTGSFNFQCYTF